MPRIRREVSSFQFIGDLSKEFPIHDASTLRDDFHGFPPKGFAERLKLPGIERQETGKSVALGLGIAERVKLIKYLDCFCRGHSHDDMEVFLPLRFLSRISRATESENVDSREPLLQNQSGLLTKRCQATQHQSACKPAFHTG